MVRLKIGLDWDDVVAPWNSVACAMANERNPGLNISIRDITTWENTGRASVVKRYYTCQELYLRQSKAITEDAKTAVRELMEYADVYFISAVYPEFMSVRASQIKEAFPEVDNSRIILGSAKDLVHFDFLLDDNLNNVLASPAEYPVLFRKPWNADMTGLLSVNTLEEFICLVKSIMHPLAHGREKIEIPSVIAIVAPSGSGKNDIAEELCKDPRFVRPHGYTTNPAGSHGKTVISEEEFENENFFEKTRYAGYGYGIKKEEIENILSEGNFPVVPIDMCGAIGMKLHFPTVTVYIQNRKEEMVLKIVSDGKLSDKEKTLRLLSLDAEKKNEPICDYSYKASNAAEEIKGLFA